MEFKIFSDKDKQFYYQSILDIMIESDNDFVPPLSMRSSTTQSDFSNTDKNQNGIIAYSKQLNEQIILGAFEQNQLLGFVSFKENYTTEIIEPKYLPNIYISTVMLTKEARGKGLTQKMYDFLFNNLYANSNIFTRTWSTNFAHLKILTKFGFGLIKTIPNDRGENIDTVYFAKFR